MSKLRITFKAHPDLIYSMHKAIRVAGYGVRGKSKWIADALTELFDIENYWEVVIEEKPMAKLNDNPECFFVSSDMRSKLDDAIRLCNLKSPFKQGLQSSIIRSAIMQKLING